MNCRTVCKVTGILPSTFVNATGNAGLLVIAGYVGLIMSLAALYTGLGEVLNDAYGRKIIPI